ncbi:MAG: DapH/DapD/GlmU-related protein [Acidobacteriia bacterium]|nr:DapH/DapD/GlmU-related protein [Terriglobia bacterium]
MKAATFVHPTALIEEGVHLGAGSTVWDHVHIRKNAFIGDECILGEKTYIAYDVRIGNRVKINAQVYICAGVSIEDGVMISARTVFTNDRFPRAATSDLQHLLPSEPDEHLGLTRVKAGATIGAGCTIGNDLSIGRFAMVGMGSVITHSVDDFHLVYGNPARSRGAVCRCGVPLIRWSGDEAPTSRKVACNRCGLQYHIAGMAVTEIERVESGEPARR